MTERNKTEIIFFLKMLALVLWGIITIITFAGVLNYCPEPFVKWCSGIVLVMNAVIIVRYVKRLSDEYKATIKAIQQKEQEEFNERNKGK